MPQYRQADVEAEYDIADVATCFEYYGGLANKVLGTVNPVPANALSFTLRNPSASPAKLSVELSITDGRMETRACACRRLPLAFSNPPSKRR